jgi:hypothetical protein
VRTPTLRRGLFFSVATAVSTARVRTGSELPRRDARRRHGPTGPDVRRESIPVCVYIVDRATRRYAQRQRLSQAGARFFRARYAARRRAHAVSESTSSYRRTHAHRSPSRRICRARDCIVAGAHVPAANSAGRRGAFADALPGLLARIVDRLDSLERHRVADPKVRDRGAAAYAIML